MNVWRLVVREIAHRKLNFLLGLLSVAVAVGCLVGAMTLVRGNEFRTGELLAAKQAEVEQASRKRNKRSPPPGLSCRMQCGKSP